MSERNLVQGGLAGCAAALGFASRSGQHGDGVGLAEGGTPSPPGETALATGQRLRLRLADAALATPTAPVARLAWPGPRRNARLLGALCLGLALLGAGLRSPVMAQEDEEEEAAGEDEEEEVDESDPIAVATRTYQELAGRLGQLEAVTGDESEAKSPFRSGGASQQDAGPGAGDSEILAMARRVVPTGIYISPRGGRSCSINGDRRAGQFYREGDIYDDASFTDIPFRILRIRQGYILLKPRTAGKGMQAIRVNLGRTPGPLQAAGRGDGGPGGAAGGSSAGAGPAPGGGGSPGTGPSPGGGPAAGPGTGPVGS